MAKASIEVTGMKCGGCEKTVQAAADAVPGVQSSKASFKDGRLEVEYDDAKTSVAAIQQAVTTAGFPSA